MTSQKPDAGKNLESLFSYAKNNIVDTIAYILIILGIVLVLFSNFYGGILVGLIVGYYYSAEIISILKNVNQTIHDLGIPRALILGATVLALFISAPGIFIGGAVAAALKHVVKG